MFFLTRDGSAADTASEHDGQGPSYWFTGLEAALRPVSAYGPSLPVELTAAHPGRFAAGGCSGQKKARSSRAE